VCNCCWLTVCIVVVVLCVCVCVLLSYVYLLYYVGIAVFYFICRTADYKSVFGRSCDRPSRHRVFLVSLCLKANVTCMNIHQTDICELLTSGWSEDSISRCRSMKAADSRVWWFITSVQRPPRGQKDTYGFEKCVEEKLTPSIMLRLPIRVTAQSTDWVCRRGTAGSNPAWEVSSYFECCVCYQEEVSAMGRSLVQRSPTERFMYDCDLETSTTWRLRSIERVEPWQKKVLLWPH